MKRRSFSWLVLGLWVFVALFRDLIANDRPLYCKIGDEVYYPGLARVISGKPYLLPGQGAVEPAWRELEYSEAVFAPIPFSGKELLASAVGESSIRPPGAFVERNGRKFRHRLGAAGEWDVAAVMVYGARKALWSALLVLSTAMFFGLLLGGLAGYFGDTRLRVHPFVVLLFVAGLPFAWFFTFSVNAYQIRSEGTLKPLLTTCLYFLSAVVLWIFSLGLLQRRLSSKKTVRIPMDQIVMRGAEITDSIPTLILLFSISLFAARQTRLEPYLLIAGFLMWTNIARFLRAELLKIRESDYVAAATAMGFPTWRILWKHTFPNAKRAVLIAGAFCAGIAVLLEAGLGLLGFGDGKGSWGAIIRQAKFNWELWWLTIPPGLAICLIIFALNRLSDRENRVIST